MKIISILYIIKAYLSSRQIRFGMFLMYNGIVKVVRFSLA